MAGSRAGWTLVVSNEVGAGVVPDNELARTFRDVLGRVNAAMSLRATRAWFVAAGRVVPLLDPPTELA